MGLIKLPKESISFFKSNIDKIFSSGNLAESEWNNNLSNYIKDFTGAKIAVPTSSNGAGLVSAMSIYRHYFNRKNVFIQTNTMYGVKTMVFAAGCNLSGFISCQLNTLMPSINDIKKVVEKLTKKEKNELIILLSHIGGIVNPDILEISKLCKDENIILFEDCAHSFGATLNGEHSGLYGNLGVYSFYATKAIPAGEGGIVITNNEEIGNMILKFSIYDRFEQKLELGNNIRISEMQALLTYSVVIRWDEIIKNKSSVADRYIRACIDNEIKYISQIDKGQLGNYYKFIILSPNKKIDQAFPQLINKTSSVYDYSIGEKNTIAEYHACLPIWYLQDKKVVDETIKQLSL